MESKTIIYIRTSTEEQNPANQLQDCISINSFGEYEVIEDKQSAYKDNKERVGFNKIVEQIRQNKVANLIVWDLDRVYRNRTKLKEFLELLKIYKVKLHSYRQKWLEDINKIPNPWNEIVYELLINVFGYIAEEESIKKSERVKLAIKKEQGVTKSYKGNKWGRKALSMQKKNQINELHQAKYSIRAIAQEMNISVGAVHKYISKIKEEKTEHKQEFNN